MSFDFSKLPPIVLCNICDFLEVESLLALRQVSKTVKLQFESLVSVRQTVVDELTISTHEDDLTIFDFEFENRTDNFLWKFCAEAAFEKLEIPENCFEISMRDHSLQVTLTTEYVKRFLEYLKPFIQSTVFRTVVTQHLCQSDLIRACADFLESRHLVEINVDEVVSGTSNFDAWNYFLQIVPTEKASFDLDSLTKDAINFLFKLASDVKSININIERKIRNANIKLASLVKGMLSRKCERLSVDCSSRYSISKGDAENLIHVRQEFDIAVSSFHTFPRQLWFLLISRWGVVKLLVTRNQRTRPFFHRMEKRFYLTVPFKGKSIDIQVGLYNIEAYLGEISIRHMDLEEDYRE